MHTTTFKRGNNITHVHHNGDFSGEVEIPLSTFAKVDGDSVLVDFELLQFLVVTKLRHDYISKLEKMEDDEFLNKFF